MNKKHKVYCSFCRYYNTSFGIERCEHPKNRIYENFKGNYRSPPTTTFIGYKNTPNEINKDNDCIWYRKPSLVDRVLW